MQSEAFTRWRSHPARADAAPDTNETLEPLLDALDAHLGSMAIHLERVLVEEVKAAATAVQDPPHETAEHDRAAFEQPGEKLVAPDPYVLVEPDDRQRSLAHFAFRDIERADRFLGRAGREELDLLEAWYEAAMFPPKQRLFARFRRQR
jgi:hypothetical protein